jgi:hypothetical protein
MTRMQQLRMRAFLCDNQRWHECNKCVPFYRLRVVLTEDTSSVTLVWIHFFNDEAELQVGQQHKQSTQQSVL